MILARLRGSSSGRNISVSKDQQRNVINCNKLGSKFTSQTSLFLLTLNFNKYFLLKLRLSVQFCLVNYNDLKHWFWKYQNITIISLIIGNHSFSKYYSFVYFIYLMGNQHTSDCKITSWYDSVYVLFSCA